MKYHRRSWHILRCVSSRINCAENTDFKNVSGEKNETSHRTASKKANI